MDKDFTYKLILDIIKGCIIPVVKVAGKKLQDFNKKNNQLIESNNISKRRIGYLREVPLMYFFLLLFFIPGLMEDVFWLRVIFTTLALLTFIGFTFLQLYKYVKGENKFAYNYKKYILNPY
jgi:hypothetical protein